MPSISHRSISFKIAFHSAWVLCLTGMVTVVLLNAIFPFQSAGAQGSSFLQSMASGAFFLALAVAFLLAMVAAALVGCIAHLQLRELRQLGTTAEALARSGFDHAPKMTETATPELASLQRSYNKMRHQIQGLLRNMREIMDHIAHDILTPVTRLRGHAEIQLHRPGTPPQVDETCGHVVEECDHILNLVNSIFKLAAVESGLKTWEWEPLDLVSLIEDGCDLFTPVIDHKEQNLEMDLPGKCMIRGDRSAVQRMIANLLDNAIKYTPPGGQLNVALNQEAQQAQLTFTDTGVGIDESEHNLIFQRFYRGDESRSKPGHGLGLSFCFYVVQAMGGQIHLDSTRNEGTTFTITIPLEIPQERVA